MKLFKLAYSLLNPSPPTCMGTPTLASYLMNLFKTVPWQAGIWPLIERPTWIQISWIQPAWILWAHVSHTDSHKVQTILIATNTNSVLIATLQNMSNVVTSGSKYFLHTGSNTKPSIDLSINKNICWVLHHDHKTGNFLWL